MTNIESKKIFIARNLILIILTFQISTCAGQVKEKSGNDSIEKSINYQPLILNQSTTFPQIHTNLNGMVSEFVRAMYQDKKGNYWFGTNTNGIIRYDGKSLDKITIKTTQRGVSVREIVEDKVGNVWFATSSGLVKFDGEKFATYSTEAGLQNEEIWSICIDRKGLIWVSTIGGVSHFDGKKFKPFLIPNTMVGNPQHMLSDKLVFQFLEDKNGDMWFVTDGNGIFKNNNGEFIHLTTKNGLTDNNVADLIEDKQGNIWIGTFYGGVSKFDGKTFTNFTKDGIIKGIETYNFCEDSLGNIWFSAEGFGVYRYDGVDFTQFTTENGLTTNVVQSIFEDNKGQLWFGTWQGISIFDGHSFKNAKDKEPWTN
ncbi:MAG: two-component regulator propeller domain-containing protein [Lentimicrobium sp.]